MKRLYIVLIIVAAAIIAKTYMTHAVQENKPHVVVEKVVPLIQPVIKAEPHEVIGKIENGDNLHQLFSKHNLSADDLPLIQNASEKIYRVQNLVVDRPYKFVLDSNNQIISFFYSINDDYTLRVNRTESGFISEKVQRIYEKRILSLGGIISGNLISSMGEGNAKQSLALSLADIFAWDIDFTTDLRNGDAFKIIVEELYEGNEFKKYGKILAAEFINDGSDYKAYWFELEEGGGYYDTDGKSLRRAFLKAPLSFRRISSKFTNRRFHPILKIYRPHHGVDYEAPRGVPVSATGNGVIVGAGIEGGYGNLVIIKHPNGYKTYYGHLSRYAKGVSKGVKVSQGQIVGYVGSTGLATSPHLHYEMRLNDKFVNPLKLKVPYGKPIPEIALEKFVHMRDELTVRLASVDPSVPIPQEEKSDKFTMKEGSIAKN